MPQPRRRRQQPGYRALRHSLPLTDDDRRLLRLLEQPPMRVWPRKVLAQAAGLSDRAMRDCISRIAIAGIAVLSSSGTGGYWIARTADEVHAAKSEQISRLRVIASRAQALDQVERLLRDREAAGAAASPTRQGALI